MTSQVRPITADDQSKRHASRLQAERTRQPVDARVTNLKADGYNALQIAGILNMPILDVKRSGGFDVR